MRADFELAARRTVGLRVAQKRVLLYCLIRQLGGMECLSSLPALYADLKREDFRNRYTPEKEPQVNNDYPKIHPAHAPKVQAFAHLHDAPAFIQPTPEELEQRAAELRAQADAAAAAQARAEQVAAAIAYNHARLLLVSKIHGFERNETGPVVYEEVAKHAKDLKDLAGELGYKLVRVGRDSFAIAAL